MVWQKYLCIDCHTILGNGAYYGPDLTKSWTRFVDRAHGDPSSARLALAAYLRHPPGATASRRGMPDVKMSEAEAAALTEFLKWTSEIDTNGWPPGPRRAAIAPVAAARPPGNDPAGAKLFADRGCGGCHSVGGGPVIGPDLATAAMRYDRATLVKWMTDASAVYATRGGHPPVNPGFPEMPSLGIDERDAGQIADYLIVTATGRSQS
jgi:mono/diheme cytochrome c family protein